MKLKNENKQIQMFNDVLCKIIEEVYDNYDEVENKEEYFSNIDIIFELINSLFTDFLRHLTVNSHYVIL